MLTQEKEEKLAAAWPVCKILLNCAAKITTTALGNKVLYSPEIVETGHVLGLLVATNGAAITGNAKLNAIAEGYARASIELLNTRIKVNAGDVRSPEASKLQERTIEFLDDAFYEISMGLVSEGLTVKGYGG